MRWLALGILIVTAGCTRKPAAPATGPQAVVLLKDGTSFAGVVTQSSPAQITLTAPNNEAHTYQMSQVDSVQYANTAPAPAASIPAPAPAPVQDAAPPPPPSQPPPPPPPAVIPVGRHIAVRNNALIDSHSATPGQFYSAVIARPVTGVSGAVVIPQGAEARLVVRSVRAQGKVQGESELALDLDSVVIAGHRYRVETADIIQKGKEGVGTNSRTAKFIGGGTVLGTILGAVAGGGRGAAIGAVSGAAAGTATQTVTRGKGVRVPAETVLTFRLEAPVRVISEP